MKFREILQKIEYFLAKKSSGVYKNIKKQTNQQNNDKKNQENVIIARNWDIGSVNAGFS